MMNPACSSTASPNGSHEASTTRSSSSDDDIFNEPVRLKGSKSTRSEGSNHPSLHFQATATPTLTPHSSAVFARPHIVMLSRSPVSSPSEGDSAGGTTQRERGLAAAHKRRSVDFSEPPSPHGRQSVLQTATATVSSTAMPPRSFVPRRGHEERQEAREEGVISSTTASVNSRSARRHQSGGPRVVVCGDEGDARAREGGGELSAGMEGASLGSLAASDHDLRRSMGGARPLKAKEMSDEQYLKTFKINTIISHLSLQLLQHKPEDHVEFTRQWLLKTLETRHEQKRKLRRVLSESSQQLQHISAAGDSSGPGEDLPSSSATSKLAASTHKTEATAAASSHSILHGGERDLFASFSYNADKKPQEEGGGLTTTGLRAEEANSTPSTSPSSSMRAARHHHKTKRRSRRRERKECAGDEDGAADGDAQVQRVPQLKARADYPRAQHAGSGSTRVEGGPQPDTTEEDDGSDVQPLTHPSLPLQRGKTPLNPSSDSNRNESSSEGDSDGFTKLIHVRPQQRLSPHALGGADNADSSVSKGSTSQCSPVSLMKTHAPLYYSAPSSEGSATTDFTVDSDSIRGKQSAGEGERDTTEEEDETAGPTSPFNMTAVLPGSSYMVGEAEPGEAGSVAAGPGTAPAEMVKREADEAKPPSVTATVPKEEEEEELKEKEEGRKGMGDLLLEPMTNMFPALADMVAQEETDFAMFAPVMTIGSEATVPDHSPKDQSTVSAPACLNGTTEAFSPVRLGEAGGKGGLATGTEHHHPSSPNGVPGPSTDAPATQGNQKNQKDKNVRTTDFFSPVSNSSFGFASGGGLSRNTSFARVNLRALTSGLAGQLEEGASGRPRFRANRSRLVMEDDRAVSPVAERSLPGSGAQLESAELPSQPDLETPPKQLDFRVTVNKLSPREQSPMPDPPTPPLNSVCATEGGRTRVLDLMSRLTSHQFDTMMIFLKELVEGGGKKEKEEQQLLQQRDSMEFAATVPAPTASTAFAASEAALTTRSANVAAIMRDALSQSVLRSIPSDHQDPLTRHPLFPHEIRASSAPPKSEAATAVSDSSPVAREVTIRFTPTSATSQAKALTALEAEADALRTAEANEVIEVGSLPERSLFEREEELVAAPIVPVTRQASAGSNSSSSSHPGKDDGEERPQEEKEAPPQTPDDASGSARTEAKPVMESAEEFAEKECSETEVGPIKEHAARLSATGSPLDSDNTDSGHDHSSPKSMPSIFALSAADTPTSGLPHEALFPFATPPPAASCGAAFPMPGEPMAMAPPTGFASTAAATMTTRGTSRWLTKSAHADPLDSKMEVPKELLKTEKRLGFAGRRSKDSAHIFARSEADTVTGMLTVPVPATLRRSTPNSEQTAGEGRTPKLEGRRHSHRRGSSHHSHHSHSHGRKHRETSSSAREGHQTGGSSSNNNSFHLAAPSLYAFPYSPNNSDMSVPPSAPPLSSELAHPQTGLEENMVSVNTSGSNTNANNNANSNPHTEYVNATMPDVDAPERVQVMRAAVATASAIAVNSPLPTALPAALPMEITTAGTVAQAMNHFFHTEDQIQDGELRQVRESFVRFDAFAALDETQLETMIRCTTRHVYENGAVLLKEGESAPNRLLLVLSGKLVCSRKGLLVRVVQAGKFYSVGDASYDMDRCRQTVVTRGETVVYTLSRLDYQKLILFDKEARQCLFLQYVNKAPFFSRLPTECKMRIADGLRVCRLPKGSTLIHRHSSVEWMYLIMSGEVQLTAKIIKPHTGAADSTSNPNSNNNSNTTTNANHSHSNPVTNDSCLNPTSFDGTMLYASSSVAESGSYNNASNHPNSSTLDASHSGHRSKMHSTTRRPKLSRKLTAVAAPDSLVTTDSDPMASVIDGANLSVPQPQQQQQQQQPSKSKGPSVNNSFHRGSLHTHTCGKGQLVGECEYVFRCKGIFDAVAVTPLQVARINRLHLEAILSRQALEDVKYFIGTDQHYNFFQSVMPESIQQEVRAVIMRRKVAHDDRNLQEHRFSSKKGSSHTPRLDQRRMRRQSTKDLLGGAADGSLVRPINRSVDVVAGTLHHRQATRRRLERAHTMAAWDAVDSSGGGDRRISGPDDGRRTSKSSVRGSPEAVGPEPIGVTATRNAALPTPQIDVSVNSKKTSYNKSRQKTQSSRQNSGNDKRASRHSSSQPQVRINAEGEIIFSGSRNMYRFPVRALSLANTIFIAVIADGTIIRWNAAAQEATGYAPFQVVGQSLFNLIIGSESRDWLRATLRLATRYAGKWEDFVNAKLATPTSYTFHYKGNLSTANLTLSAVPSMVSSSSEVLLLVGHEEQYKAANTFNTDVALWLRQSLQPHLQSFQEELGRLEQQSWRFTPERAHALSADINVCLAMVEQYTNLSQVNMDTVSESWKPLRLARVVEGFLPEATEAIAKVGPQSLFNCNVSQVMPKAEVFMDLSKVMKLLRLLLQIAILTRADGEPLVVELTVTAVEPDMNKVAMGGGLDRQPSALLPSSASVPVLDLKEPVGHAPLTAYHLVPCVSETTTSQEELRQAADHAVANASGEKPLFMAPASASSAPVVHPGMPHSGSNTAESLGDASMRKTVQLLPSSLRRIRVQLTYHGRAIPTFCKGRQEGADDALTPEEKASRPEDDLIDEVNTIMKFMGGLLYGYTPPYVEKNVLRAELPLLAVPGSTGGEEGAERGNSTSGFLATPGTDDYMDPHRGGGGAAGTLVASIGRTVLLADNNRLEQQLLCSVLWSRQHAVVPVNNFRDLMRKVQEPKGADILLIEPLQLDITAEDYDDIEGDDPFDDLLTASTHMVLVVMATDFTDWRVQKLLDRNGVIELPKLHSAPLVHIAMQEAERMVAEIREEEERIERIRRTFVNTREDHRKIGRVIGSGTFGDVFEVEDVLTGGKMAMKRMRIHDALTVDEVLQEILAMTALRHENIIHYFFCEKVDETTLRLYMELAPGGSLLQKVRKSEGKPLPFDDIVHYLTDLCRGLAYVHSQHYVHADLKSANLLLDARNRLKIGDFGTSKQLRPGQKLHKMMGTPLYMAPEVLTADETTKEGGYDFKADIWSVGCIALEMATGRPPFDHVESSHGLGIMKYLSDLTEAPDLSPLFKGNPLVYEFVKSCLDVDPSNRPNAQDLLRFELLQGAVSSKRAERMVKRAEMLYKLNKYAAMRVDENEENSQHDSDSSDSSGALLHEGRHENDGRDSWGMSPADAALLAYSDSDAFEAAESVFFSSGYTSTTGSGSGSDNSGSYESGSGYTNSSSSVS